MPPPPSSTSSRIKTINATTLVYPLIKLYYTVGLGLGWMPGPPPGIGCAVGAGDVTVGFCDGAVCAPNQFHCVKPKNKRISTSKAMTAAAMPALIVSLVSTTSEPAGLQ